MGLCLLLLAVVCSRLKLIKVHKKIYFVFSLNILIEIHIHKQAISLVNNKITSSALLSHACLHDTMNDWKIERIADFIVVLSFKHIVNLQPTYQNDPIINSLGLSNLKKTCLKTSFCKLNRNLRSFNIFCHIHYK